MRNLHRDFAKILAEGLFVPPSLEAHDIAGLVRPSGRRADIGQLFFPGT